ncbi:MAG: hypothetical protein ACI8XB_002063 [Patiriisocius sp.]|jgi:hypothetical protein
MNQFLMLFRKEKSATPPPPMSPEQMQAMIKPWQDWLGGIAAQDKLVSSEALMPNGKTIHPDNMVTDGPYMEVKEIVNGYALVKAADHDEAMKMAEGCPILKDNGFVEVRPIMDFGV